MFSTSKYLAEPNCRFYSDYARIILNKAKSLSEKQDFKVKGPSLRKKLIEDCKRNVNLPEKIFKNKNFMHSYLHTLELCSKLIRQREEQTGKKSHKSSSYSKVICKPSNPCTKLNEKAQELYKSGNMDQLFQMVSLNTSHDLMKKFAGKDFNKKSFEFLRILKRSLQENGDISRV